MFGVYDKKGRLWGLAPTKAAGNQAARALNLYFGGTGYTSRMYIGAVKIVDGKRVPVALEKMIAVRASHGGRSMTWGKFSDPEAGILSKALTELFLGRVHVETAQPSRFTRVATR